ncbi:hypothetical protein ACP4OV_009414 [Aristida adscensionis]
MSEAPTTGADPSSPAPASLPEIDDVVTEILLRLPPAPSSLPRASLVCKRWRRLATDPAFLRRFRARHRRRAPLLGFFSEGEFGVSFATAMDAPDSIPPDRLTSPEAGARRRRVADPLLPPRPRPAPPPPPAPAPGVGPLHRRRALRGRAAGFLQQAHHPGPQRGGAPRRRRLRRRCRPLPGGPGRRPPRTHACVRLRLLVGHRRVGQDHLGAVPIHGHARRARSERSGRSSSGISTAIRYASLNSIWKGSALPRKNCRRRWPATTPSSGSCEPAAAALACSASMDTASSSGGGRRTATAALVDGSWEEQSSCTSSSL